MMLEFGQTGDLPEKTGEKERVKQRNSKYL